MDGYRVGTRLYVGRQTVRRVLNDSHGGYLPVRRPFTDTQPPSIRNSWPLTWSLAGAARNAVALATSSSQMDLIAHTLLQKRAAVRNRHHDASGIVRLSPDAESVRFLRTVSSAHRGRDCAGEEMPRNEASIGEWDR